MSSALALRLNRHFTQRYAQSRATALSQALVLDRPIIVRLESALIFLRSGSREREEILGDEYHAYKSVAHVPATLTLALLQAPPPPTAQLADLARDLHSLLDSTQADDAMRGVLRPSAALIDAWLEARRRSPDAAPDASLTAEFKTATQRAIGACMVAAARAEVEKLHRVVSAWTYDFADRDWRSLKVVICASHQARYRESTKLYFQRLLAQRLGHQKNQESRAAEDEHQVIYAENCSTEEEALGLLATHQVDRELASWLLGDRTSLQADVIGDTFDRLLDELFE